MENIYINIFLSGLLILIVAILMNFLAGIFNLSTWYDFLKNVQVSGLIEAVRNTTFLSYLFLLFIYPFCLGLVGYLAFNYLIK